jgi:hypothetical protein
MRGLVYQAINAVAADFAEIGIPKGHRNEQDDYLYRSIDDVQAALAPLLARHKLCVLPRILERQAIPLGEPQSGQLVTVRAAFDLVSALDGSVHAIESFGEAIDDSDKGTAKATSAAFKSAMIQAFCIPVPQTDTASASPRFGRAIAQPEPPEGWEAWTQETSLIAATCETGEAIERLMSARRALLASLQRSRPELYTAIGEAIADRLAALRPKGRSDEELASAKRKGSRKSERTGASGQTAKAA